ncbi:MAG: ribbon-helix-helix domain-containing protein, partial [Chloroflexi bacterium]|nr:ribbon-helix-helix domain-containing protein [Chloroflexota bacterium]
MRKTSVYLSDDESDGLRRAATLSGRSQAELIREGVQSLLAQKYPRERVFHSLGHGSAGGGALSWDAEDLYN